MREQPLKIALVGPVHPYRGGIAHHTTQLAGALRDEGCQVVIFSFRRQYPAFLYPGKTDQDPSHEPLQIQAQRLLDPLNPFSWLRCSRLIAAQGCQAAVMPWWTTYWAIPFRVVASRLRKRGIRVVYLVHNTLPHETLPWDAWLAKSALLQADLYVAQNPLEITRLRRLIPQAIAAWCPHPIYTFASRLTIPVARARAKLNLPPDAKVILFFGIVRPYKGLEVLVEAMASLNQRGIPFHLLVAGEFWHGKTELLSQAKVHGLSSYLHIFDRYVPNEEIPLYFSAADLLVAPYVGGTQSGAATLALSFGLPLVVTEQIAGGIPPELHSRLAIAKAGDAASLAEAILSQLEQSSSPRQPLTPTEAGWQRLAQTVMRACQPGSEAPEEQP